MKFLKTLVAAVAIPVIGAAAIAVALLISVVVFIVTYLAWLIGIPVPIKVNGNSRKYRWLNQVY